MSHWRTSRRAVGGNQLSGSPYALSTLRDLDRPPLPSGSVLKSFEVSKPTVHKFQAFESALFVITTAAALFVGLALLFVDL